MSQNSVIIRQLNRRGYESVLHAMQDFTDTRNDDTPDEIWLVEHDPVFTQGQAGKEEHLLMPGDIPVVKVDRGGQVTYHGPGQQVLYVMFNLRRLKIGVRELVTWLEEAIVETLVQYGIKAYAKPDAPGVYVDDSKIASLGLRVRKGCSFHGLALNIDMDLTPFLRINPCGYAGMTMIQSKDLSGPQNLEEAANGLVKSLLNKLQQNNADLTSIQIQGFENE
ncbi:lipoyl(octanoyl) transferase LipB [Pseudoalteromonas sp. C2R02]|uniref:lipoyl(octanoyl) transferase LipB n=1 Tax=Pseudoalteromonas sp. C2R02 TaxID=2841565 RepID=UPI001C096C78|nr:lipoyl(octanoyl) transferase LipB [Pseudoalteromonas sp. C2R02]MBU2971270.1 lipoyl(octanoyl) transferase LipB [Pseudoalteromonas sp. C2R02]